MMNGGRATATKNVKFATCPSAWNALQMLNLLTLDVSA